MFFLWRGILEGAFLRTVQGPLKDLEGIGGGALPPSSALAPYPEGSQGGPWDLKTVRGVALQGPYKAFKGLIRLLRAL